MPTAEWTIADAKRRLSEVLNLAKHEPQFITGRSRRCVVLNGAEYSRLKGSVPTLKQLILSGPSLEGVFLKRDRPGARELER
jgi:prevent-host-death family protein